MKMHWEAADCIRFALSGRGTQRFLGRAAQAGIRLWQVEPERGGLSASALGADWARLCRTAQEGGWQISAVRRQGPGRWLERLCRRPGLAVGALCFLWLFYWLGGFLWCIDLDLLTAQQQETVRAVLADCGVREGVRPTQALLAEAQQALELTGDYGWVSLNFTGGCLRAEGTPRQQAEPESPAQNNGLYARTGGEILAVNVESGFAQVQPGQYVSAGTPLVLAEKAARDGSPVPQAARGTVTARVRAAYTGQQSFAEQQTILTGRHAEARDLCMLGLTLNLPGSAALDADAPARVRWLPVALGRLALPASVREVCVWERAEQRLTHTPEAAAALARRAARRQLLQDYPDAVIETEKHTESATQTAAVCRTLFIFCADIAQEKSASPAEP